MQKIKIKIKLKKENLCYPKLYKHKKSGDIVLATGSDELVVLSSGDLNDQPVCRRTGYCNDDRFWKPYNGTVELQNEILLHVSETTNDRK